MPLSVLVVGAGIAGLTTTIALTEQGHHVEVFERSSFSAHDAVGAAVHLAPNATRVLLALGLDVERAHPVRCRNMRFWDSNQELKSTRNVDKMQQDLGITGDFVMVRRNDFHALLLERVSQDPRARLHLRARIAGFDYEHASLTLEDGTVHRGDLIVGADGVHSVTVQHIAGPSCRPSPGHTSMFRFLIPRERIRSDPATCSFLERAGVDGFDFFKAEGEEAPRGIFVYPCRDGEIINCAAIYPNVDAEQCSRRDYYDWQNPSTAEAVREIYKDFAPQLLHLIALAEDVKHWTLANRDPPPTFVKDRLVLVGDAAHPTQPMQGQGAAQGIEDAAVLGALLCATATTANLERRLRLYDGLRYRRSVLTMVMSMALGTREAQRSTILKKWLPEAEPVRDMPAYLWPTDVAGEATEALRSLEMKEDMNDEEMVVT